MQVSSDYTPLKEVRAVIMWRNISVASFIIVFPSEKAVEEERAEILQNCTVCFYTTYSTPTLGLI